MLRKRLIIFITVTYALLATTLGTWTYRSWNLSSPSSIAQAAVLGVSTDPQLPLQPPQPSLTPHYSLKSNVVLPAVATQSYILYAPESGQILASSGNVNLQRPIASITKQMTALLTTELAQPQEIVIVPQQATIQVDASLAGLVTDQHISIEELLYGLLLPSGNDAADTLAWYIGGKGHESDSYDQRIARFVTLMNQKAKDLGMNNTLYQDASGFNDKGLSTPLDQVKLNAVLLQQPLLAQIIATPSHGTWINSNRDLNDAAIPGTLGGKTGHTIAAGHCLITAARQNGATLIAGTFHTEADDNGEAAASQVQTILNFGFANLQIDK